MQSTRVIQGWVLYDWANSAFATTMMATVLPAFYSQVAAANLAPGLASSLWGYTNTAAMLIIALMAPIMGAIADYKAAKKRFLAIFAGAGILATACVASVGSGMWLLASIYYILGRIGFAGANIFYDALLPHVAPPGKMDQVSTLGYAVGYAGGGVLLALNLGMISFPHRFGIADAEWGARYAFLSVAVWWALFSLPLWRWVPEPPAAAATLPRVNPVVAGFRRLQETVRHLRTYRQAVRFLLAFWLYNDGIGTIIVMAVIFGVEIGIGQSDLIGAILLVQFIGIPCSLGFGRLAQRLGAKHVIYLGLAVYTGIAIGGYFLHTAWHFWLLAIAVATVQGGTQALSRSLYGSLIPAERSAEFFGFYDISQKFSGIVGPTVFALIGQLTGSSRLGIVALVVFFLGGGAILVSVNVEAGRDVATGRETL